jgi:hypothetical protein
MDAERFQGQLRIAVQDEEEVKAFVEDFVIVRLTHIVGRLLALEDANGPAPTPREGPQLDWHDPLLLAESGVDLGWIADMADPAEAYLHVEAAMHGDSELVSQYLDMAFLSTKQRPVLFPVLRQARRPANTPRKALAEEAQRLNRILRWAAESGMTRGTFSRYREHVAIHGASQNVIARVGEIGARLAVRDAIEEIGADQIVDACGDPLPEDVRTPIEVYRHYYERSSPERAVSALLLRNGRAVVFASDPDIAIFQSLGERYSTAAEARSAWEDVRRDVSGRSRRVHVFAEGEVKTATDRQSLHERLALGSRETRQEVRTDRFLMMAILVPDLFDPRGGRRRRGAGLVSRDVERFSDVFNLHFAWGYGGLRAKHAEHWSGFHTRIREWCLR